MIEGGYWISPRGEIIKAHDHFLYIREHPVLFGFDENDPRLSGSVRRKFGSFKGLRSFRDEVLIEAIRRNWIRIRMLVNESDHVNVRKLDRKTLDRLFDFYSRFPAGYNSKQTVFTELSSGMQFRKTPKEVIMENPRRNPRYRKVRLSNPGRRKKDVVRFQVDWNSASSIKSAERKKRQLENAGYMLLTSSGTLNKSFFVYGSPSFAASHPECLKRRKAVVWNNPKNRRAGRRNPSRPNVSSKALQTFRKIHGCDPDRITNIGPGKENLIALGEVLEVAYRIPFSTKRDKGGTVWVHKFTQKPVLALTVGGKPCILFMKGHRITQRGLIG